MSGDAPKKRAWFQIHLSTAVVLMVIAAILIGLNIGGPELGPGWGSRGFTYVVTRPGFPFNYQYQIQGPNPFMVPDFELDLTQTPEIWESESFPTLAANVFFCVLVLCGICVYTEFLFRRRERRQEEAQA